MSAVSGMVAAAGCTGAGDRGVVELPEYPPAPSAQKPEGKAAVASSAKAKPSAAPAAAPPSGDDVFSGVFGDANDSKNCCKGQNDCKGRGQCKTARNACKGQNGCKGQGGCKPANCP